MQGKTKEVGLEPVEVHTSTHKHLKTHRVDMSGCDGYFFEGTTFSDRNIGQAMVPSDAFDGFMISKGSYDGNLLISMQKNGRPYGFQRLVAAGLKNPHGPNARCFDYVVGDDDKIVALRRSHDHGFDWVYASNPPGCKLTNM